MRAQCYLHTTLFHDAEKEAARILVWDPYDESAMLVKAEALYLQCKVIIYFSTTIFIRGISLKD